VGQRDVDYYKPITVHNRLLLDRRTLGRQVSFPLGFTSRRCQSQLRRFTMRA
jgi:hypothetical protein